MKLFSSIKKLFQETPRFPSNMTDWHSAGILFTSQDNVLIGYKVVDDEWVASGFGGKREEGEEYYQTAIREVLEELFEVPIIKQVVDYVANRIKIKYVANNGGYILVICDIKEISHFMLAALNFMLKSPLYDELPHSIHSLIGKRKTKVFPEFHYLALVSTQIVVSKRAPFNIDPYFVSDMKYIKEE